MFEIENSCPVVGEILLESTGCASREACKVIIWVHGDIESESLSYQFKKKIYKSLTHSIYISSNKSVINNDSRANNK